MTADCRVCGSSDVRAYRIKQNDPICRRCDREQQKDRRHAARLAELTEQLDRSVVANGRLRLELYDLRRELNRLKHGRDYGLPDNTSARRPLDSRAATCTHGVPLPEPCSACGIVEE